jgi:peptidoglycan/xylan/chitin deacetylase (PgdA/CDA1 family)
MKPRASMFLFRAMGRTIWRLPFGFRHLTRDSSNYSLRCVLFHHIADAPCSFTEKLRITTSRSDFERTIRFLSRNYTPVTLDDVIGGLHNRKFSRPPVLVTFDDAYSSVALVAAPICQRYNVPAVYFVNARFIGNRELGLDNLLSHVASNNGLMPITQAAEEVSRQGALRFQDLQQVSTQFLPLLSPQKRGMFSECVAAAAGVFPAELARQASLYMTEAQLRSLSAANIEVANHTFSHVHGRTLSGADMLTEIGDNKNMLEAITGTSVRAFSVPYGSHKDLTPALGSYLRETGHQAAFLVESTPNTPATSLYQLHRVSVRSTNDADLFGELEILPRLRLVRNGLLQLSPRYVA